MVKPLLSEPLLERTPLDKPQSDTLDGGSKHPSLSGIQIALLPVAGSVKKDCAGVPTLSMKLDQLPSIPIHDPDGSMTRGAGIDGVISESRASWYWCRSGR